MDYTAKINLQRIKLSNDKIYNDYIAFLDENIKKVSSTYYELMQAKIVAVSFADENAIPEKYSILRDIALSYYRIKF